MQHARAPAAPLAPFTIETPNFLVRCLKPADATDRWAAWFESAYVLDALNLNEAPRTKADMQRYIAGFDQHSRLLMGVFDKANGLLVGIGSAQIEWDIGNYVINMLIGEPAYRNTGVLSELTPPFRDYFFDVLGLKTSTATALATNTVMRTFLERTGWTLLRILKNHTRSQKDGSMIDLYLYKLTCEAWREWRRVHPDTPRADLSAKQ